MTDKNIGRKDRWEQGVRRIWDILAEDPRKGFEIDEVVSKVRKLKAGHDLLSSQVKAYTEAGL